MMNQIADFDPDEASKFDKDKRRNLAPIRAVNLMNDVFTYGAEKYSPGNWHQGEGFDWDRLDDALERHLNAWRLGEDIDPESGLHHLGHAMCCLAMMTEHSQANIGSDTRTRNQHIIEKETK